MITSTLHPVGPFSVAAAAAFTESFPATDATGTAEELRFAWPVDDAWQTVQATVRQHGDAVRVELARSIPADLARLGHRIRVTQAVVVKQRLAAELGEHGAFPAPDRLATLTAPSAD